MNVIVHKIRLRDGVTPERFETWVKTTDYAACPRLASVLRFDVHRVTSVAQAAFHYVEVVQIRSLAAFEQDMASELFQGLVAAFSQLAEVVEEVSGDTLAPGYLAATEPPARG